MDGGAGPDRTEHENARVRRKPIWVTPAGRRLPVESPSPLDSPDKAVSPRWGFLRLWQRFAAVASRRKSRRTASAFASVDPLEVRQLLAAPVNNVPTGQSAPGNMPLVFTALRGNVLSVSDSDAGESPLTVTLTASHGVLSFPNSGPGDGLTFSEGDGSADASLTFTGTIGEINRALGWIIFLPEQGYTGAASVTLTTSDEGSPETGPESDTDVVTVDVTAVTGTEQTFSVQDFGALGDGVTDDAPAIRATIAAAIAAGGGTILFPPGIYLLNSFDPGPGAKTHFRLNNCDGLRFSGDGAVLSSTASVRSTVFSLDGARRIEFDGFSVEGRFARHNNTITQESAGVFTLTSTNRDSDGIRISNIHVEDAYYLIVSSNELNTPYRVRNVSLEHCEFVNGFYGLNFRNNCDNFIARDFRTEGLVRSYFPYGVDSHDVEYTSVGGDTFTDCLIKAYQRDTTNISVKVKVLANTSQDAKLTLESQHNPWLQPTPAKLQNIRVQFDDTTSIGPKSVRFSYFQDTPHPIQTPISASTLFDNVIISGRARNAAEYAVHEAIPGVINTTWLHILPTVGLSSISISEDRPLGTTVGRLSTSGAAAEGTFTYSLVSGIGGADNAGFVIVGDELQTASLFNFEEKRSDSVRVRSTAEDGSFSEQVFMIDVQDVDEYDVGAVSDLDAATDSVSERAAIGTRVGITAFASDADGSNRTVTYSLVDDAGGRFAINNVTGIVTVADSSLLDFEQAATHTVRVRAMGSDGSMSEAYFVINLRDVNEFKVSTVTDLDPGPSSVREGAANGTPVGLTARAVDRDGTMNRVTYSLWSNVGGRFAIDAATGVVTVANGNLLNREAAGAWAITVLATSEDGSVGVQEFTIQLEDVDEYDVGQVFDLDSAANSVLENSTSGTLVGLTAFAVDADATDHAVTYSLSSSASGRFAINPVTGVVMVAEGATLDREEAASWTITVVATSQDGSACTKDFTIPLQDVDEHHIGGVFDLNSAPNAVYENSGHGALVGITGFGADRDATPSAVTYTLFNTRGGRFAINPTTGVVTVANGGLLDREAAASWAITILATGQDGSVSAQDFTIHVLDVDEYKVGQVFELDAAANSVAENAPNGTVVGVTGFAVDLDATSNAVTYALEGDAGGRFGIDPTTGVVTVADGSILDREAASEWRITVRATSADGSVNRKTFSIAVTDVDDLDVGQVNDINSAANRVVENSAGGTLVGITAKAVDGDVTNNTVTYRLANDAEGRFQIHPTTGVVSVAPGADLDFEAAASLEITVEAKSSDGSTSLQSFEIVLANIFDSPRLTISNATVAESQPAGTLVGTLGPADVETATAVYALVSGAGGADNSRFTIEGNELRTRTALNYESKSSYTIRVQMQSPGGAALVQVFTIQATNVNEGPTGLTISSSTVPENNEVGVTVGRFQGLDPDRGDQLSYSLVTGQGSADNALFTIEGNELKAAEVLSSRGKRTYSIRVRVTDAGGLSYEKVLTIRVGKSANRPPKGTTSK
jgi:hypothetical protein